MEKWRGEFYNYIEKMWRRYSKPESDERFRTMGGKGQEMVNVAIVDNNPRRPGCTNEKKKIQETDETQ